MAQPDRPISEILEDIVRNVQEIVPFGDQAGESRAQARCTEVFNSTTWMAIGAVCGLLGSAVLVSRRRRGAGARRPGVGAALLVGIALAIVAAVLIKVGSRRFSQAMQAPLAQTMESLNETMRGTRAWISSHD